MSRRQEYASRCNDPFPFLETYMTVNVRPVSGILKELYDIQRDSKIPYDQMEAIHHSIDCLHIMIRMAKDVPRTRCCSATELYTVITGEAAQELDDSSALQDQLKL